MLLSADSPLKKIMGEGGAIKERRLSCRGQTNCIFATERGGEGWQMVNRARRPFP